MKFKAGDLIEWGRLSGYVVSIKPNEYYDDGYEMCWNYERDTKFGVNTINFIDSDGTLITDIFRMEN